MRALAWSVLAACGTFGANMFAPLAVRAANRRTPGPTSDLSPPGEVMPTLPTDPWYARMGSAILSASGPMALIAIGLCWFMTYIVWGQLQVNAAKIDKVHLEIQDAQVKMAAFVARQFEFDSSRQRLLEQQMRLLRQVCINGAKTDLAIRNCSE